MAELLVGRVKDYFAKIGVAGIELSGELAVGDTIRIHGHTTDFTQEVAGIQIEKQPVPKATAGQVIGIKVKERVRDHDKIYKVIP
jgi:selenocysteine-specific translation elongation factor